MLVSLASIVLVGCVEQGSLSLTPSSMASNKWEDVGLSFEVSGLRPHQYLESQKQELRIAQDLQVTLGGIETEVTHVSPEGIRFTLRAEIPPPYPRSHDLEIRALGQTYIKRGALYVYLGEDDEIDADSEADGDADGDADGGTDSGTDSDAGGDVDGDAEEEVCEPSTELCNGIDDDCNGVIDDGAGCPCDLSTYNGHTYLMCRRRRTWMGAQDYCNLYGYNLATINSRDENDHVFSWMDELPLFDTWIGLNDRFEEGRFVWESTGSLPEYTQWADGEPNSAEGEEDCVEIRITGNWNDKDCSYEFYFVCEAE